MKNIEFNSSLLDTYFQLLKNLSNSAKEQLIDRLTKSLKKEDRRPNQDMDLFGAWVSEKSANEIVDGIRTDRHFLSSCRHS